MDTNVLISGTFWTTPSFNILNNINEGKIVLIVSPAILQEYDDVLHRDEIMNKKAYSSERAQVKDDPDDNKFLEAAVAGKSEYIISNDKHILSLKEFPQYQNPHARGIPEILLTKGIYTRYSFQA